MSIKTISILSGVTLLALTATASAGPISVASSQIIAPPTSIEQAHYYRHHGWRTACIMAGMGTELRLGTATATATATPVIIIGAMPARCQRLA